MGYYTLRYFKPSESDFEAFKAVLITKAAQMLNGCNTNFSRPEMLNEL